MILKNSQSENIDPSQYLDLVLVHNSFFRFFLLLVNKEGIKLPKIQFNSNYQYFALYFSISNIV